jgi:hypothetical protein
VRLRLDDERFRRRREISSPRAPLAEKRLEAISSAEDGDGSIGRASRQTAPVLLEPISAEVPEARARERDEDARTFSASSRTCAS